MVEYERKVFETMLTCVLSAAFAEVVSRREAPGER